MDGYDPAAISEDKLYKLIRKEKLLELWKRISYYPIHMDGYDIVAAISADKLIRKEKLLELVKRLPKDYQIYKLEKAQENLWVQHEKWQVIMMFLYSYDDKLTAVEINLQKFPCEYKAIEEFLTNMRYSMGLKTYRSTTDVAADDILKKILTDFESFDKKFNQNPESESEPEPEPEPVPPKFQLREKVSLRTSDDIQCIINGIKICEKFNYVYYVKICEYASPLGPIEYGDSDDIWIYEGDLVEFKS